jgi:hypothetical protein
MRGKAKMADMKQIHLDLDRIPTRTLEADLGMREEGIPPADRLEAFSSFVQKGAIICLAGILPLGAAREYAPVARGEDEAEFRDGGGTAGGMPRGQGMDLSTLQDLVSGVGVIMTSDFSLPKPWTAGEERTNGGISR